MERTRFVAALSCLLIFYFSSYSQSIYSFQGIGSLNHQGMPNNFMMGEVGIGTPTIWHINTQNPAFLVYNNFSSFQTGLELDFRRFTTQESSSRDETGGLRYLGYAFPIIRGKWSSSFGILPYTDVNYNTFSERSVEGASNDVFQIIDDRGEGGLTNFFWANGFRVKDFSFGFRAQFTFGAIEKESQLFAFRREIVEDINAVLDTVEVQLGNPITSDVQESYADVNILFGAGYKIDLSKTGRLNFGVTYSPSTPLRGSEEVLLQRRDNNGTQIQSQEVSSSSLDFSLPTTFGLGISYQKLNVLAFGVDYERQLWSSSTVGNQTLQDFFKLSAGGNWTPDYDDISSYFERVRYSLGFNYQRQPYIIQDESLTEFGINFGASFPVSSFSSLDLGFKWGQLGQVGNGLVRENYFKVVLGATINDQWFIKRRYD
ncbi:MAG: hypothetical protein AAF789_12845 [Bacteroidota bacterium]